MVCVCKRIYSGEDGAIQKLLSGHLSLFRSIKLKLTSHIILNVHVYSLYFVVLNKILFFISHEIITVFISLHFY
jgi:hypothetical protein